ncbi:MAG: hypothetical protein ABIQ51_06815 [Mesorhizobium sp.]
MRNKTPWYIYPPEESTKPGGVDALGALVGFILILVFVLVAADHVLYHVWMDGLDWSEGFAPPVDEYHPFQSADGLGGAAMMSAHNQRPTRMPA